MKSKIASLILTALFCAAVSLAASAAEKKYGPGWDSLDARPIPSWYDEAKFGIFIHWGDYAVPAYGEWYWYNMNRKDSDTWKFHEKIFSERTKYQDFAPQFKAELFDPAQWADVFSRSGAKYIVLTSKHHDGFAMYPSDFSWNWNSYDIGPHRDLLGDLTEAVRAKGLKMGYYYSLYEWYNPLYLRHFDMYVDSHMIPQIKELVEKYKPSVLWTDGEWDKTAEQWKSREIISWLYNESSVRDELVINDRWGSDTRSKHGGFYTSENEDVTTGGRATALRKWEECHTFGAAWGYNRADNADNILTTQNIIQMLIEVVSRGGNLLLNIGPTADGRIPDIMQERLLDMGAWLKVNGDAIYGTHAWRVMSDGSEIQDPMAGHSGPGNLSKLSKYNPKKTKLVRYTAKGGDVYAIALAWPGKKLVLSQPKPSDATTVKMLGVSGDLKWRVEDGKMVIEMPPLTVDAAPCKYAYAFKLSDVK